jgi:dinuclear metal center YbgI/SA1388 family protein
LSIAAPWDKSGVQVAALRDEASHMAVLLDPTLENLERAVGSGAQFILAHHPLSMTARYPDRQDNYLKILSLLMKNDVWLYSAHTSLDANPEGPVRWLAEELELTRVVTLEPYEGTGTAPAEGETPPEYGFGFTGTLARPMSYTEFCRKLAMAMGRAEWTGCGRRPEAVFRVACCPGSGGSLMPAVAASGSDVFITGDVKYHVALEALSTHLRVLDVGHFALEEEMMRRFARRLDIELDMQVWFAPSRDPLAVEYAPQPL